MTEYNERLLKNVLQDVREEQDAELMKEIEEAKNNPMFANKENEAAEFAAKHTKKPKKKKGKTIFKAAIIVVVSAVLLSFVPFNAQGQRFSVAEIIINFVNSEFLAFDSNENDSLLLSYEGEYIPTYIPDGYSVKSVNNDPEIKEIVFSKENKVIIFKEQDIDYKTNVDYSDASDLQNIDILGYNGIFFTENEVNRVVITTENSNIYISCNDDTVDLIGFAEKIEKR